MKPQAVLRLDLETRSVLDLKKVGVYVYAEHPTTDVWCAAWAFDDEPWTIWTPGMPVPDRIRRHIESGGLIHAWNVNFERVIGWAILTPRYGWPRAKLEQYICTMARAQAMSFPGALANAASAMGLDITKDFAGSRLMLQMCRPRKIAENDWTGRNCQRCIGAGTVFDRRCDACAGTGDEYGPVITWWDDEGRRKRLYAYCGRDVEVEREIDKRVAPLSPYEQRIYWLDQKANDLGVTVDLKLCRAAQRVIEYHAKILDAEMREVTGFEVNSCDAVQQLVTWLRKQGVDTSSVNKETVIDLLGEDLPADAERALKLRQEAAKASTAKIAALIARTSPDGRMRGNLCYHGAGTGRWAGRGAQLQNLPRPSISPNGAPTEITDRDIANLMTGDPVLIGMLYERPLTFVADCIRAMLVAAVGKDLLASDFANIEGRVLAWLAGQTDKLELFAADGPVYERMGAEIFDMTTEQVIAKGKNCTERDIGKRAELGAGFQVGPPKFKAMVKKESGKIISLQLAEKAVKSFRTVNDKIVQFWPALNAAAIDAVRNPGEITICGRIKYRKHGSFLVCQLPGGRCIYYPYPRLVKNVWVKDLKTQAKRTMRLEAAREAQTAGKVKIDGEPYDSLTYKGVDTYTKKWQEIDTYGGKLVENVTQATARDLMADAMLRVDAAGYPVILTVHDEVLSEPPEGFGSAEEFDRLMSELPVWAAGCPVSAKGWRAKRYRK